jgi:hypothetical protein
MDRVEAKWLLLRRLSQFRRRGYEELRTVFGNHTDCGVVGESGTEYCIEIDILWDSTPEGDIKLLASIDDGRWRAYCPLCYGALVSPPS